MRKPQSRGFEDVAQFGTALKRINAFVLWCWKPVNPKGNQTWIFIGRIAAEAKALILCPPDAKSALIGKDPDPGKD